MNLKKWRLPLKISSAHGFVADDAGVSSVVFALSAVALFGAAGLAIDISRLQSTQQELQQVADTVCARMGRASYATYPTTSSNAGDPTKNPVMLMGKSAATAAIKDAALMKDPSQNLTVTISETSTGTTENYKISLSENSPSSFGRVVGYSGDTVSATQTCSRSPKPPSNCSPGNYIHVASFLQGNAPPSVSSATLRSKSDQTANWNYIATILDNATGNILESHEFNGNYSYSQISNETAAMTLYIQDVNADGSFPQFCLRPLQVKRGTIPNPPLPVPTHTPVIPQRPDSCDYTKYDPGINQIWSESNTYWGTFTLTPDPNNLSTSSLPKDVIISGMRNFPDYKVTLSAWFVPNTSLKVLFNTNGQSSYALAQSDYIYNAVVGKLTDVWANGQKVGDGGSVSGVSKVSDNVVNAWKLVHVWTGDEAVWEETSTGECFDVASPIAIDLPGLGKIVTTGVSTSPDVARVKLGRLVTLASAEGRARKMEWLTGNGQGFLVDNRDGRAAEDMSARRLFGNGQGFNSGYAKLESFDHSGEGVIKGADLDGLAVWIDDGDGVPKPEEIVPLTSLGISELSLKAEWKLDDQGKRHLQSYALRDGKKILTEDVWLGVGGH